MAEIIFLGTSGSVSSPHRDNTAYLIKEGAGTILMDCPGSVTQKLQRLGVDFRSVTTVLLTHGHADHTYGLPSLIQSQYMLGNTLRVFAHKETLALVRTLQKAYGLDDPKKYPRLDLRELRRGEVFTPVRGLRVSAFAVSHLYGSLGYSVTFAGSGRKAVFSGDTALCDCVIAAAKGCDALIHDCFCPERIFRKYPRLYSIHTSSLQLGVIAKAAKVRALFPVHFGSEVSYTFRELRNEIRKNFNGKLILPDDNYKLKI